MEREDSFILDARREEPLTLRFRLDKSEMSIDFSGIMSLGGAGGAGGGVVELDGLKVYTGVYENGEDIPYSGAVLDMTSG
mmetsp:Transcript_8374/g.12509  ORF Transcript_8374/g.12509 Transcript_8374/m.12509 type:complete len:80 (-) Transcript_8374:30-269(-)